MREWVCNLLIQLLLGLAIAVPEEEDLDLRVERVPNETIKYSLDFCGTWTREHLLWQGPEAIVQVSYRPILLSERTPHLREPAVVTQKKKSAHEFQMGA
jgi:hypothetical protein